MKIVKARNLDGEERRVSADKVIWRPSAYGIVIDNGKILLCPNALGNYDLPGGGIEIYESIEQGVEREFKEETGLDVKFLHIEKVCESFFSDNQNTYHSILFYCLMQYSGGKISTAGFDMWEKMHMRQAKWVSLNELDQIAIAGTFDWREVVKNYLDRELK